MKYIIWPVVTLGVILAIGFTAHAVLWCFVVSLAVWVFGTGVMISQIKGGGKDGTNLFPYVIQALGVGTMMIWQGFFA